MQSQDQNCQLDRMSNSQQQQFYFCFSKQCIEKEKSLKNLTEVSHVLRSEEQQLQCRKLHKNMIFSINDLASSIQRVKEQYIVDIHSQLQTFFIDFNLTFKKLFYDSQNILALYSIHQDNDINKVSQWINDNFTVDKVDKKIPQFKLKFNQEQVISLLQESSQQMSKILQELNPILQEIKKIDYPQINLNSRQCFGEDQLQYQQVNQQYIISPSNNIQQLNNVVCSQQINVLNPRQIKNESQSSNQSQNISQKRRYSQLSQNDQPDQPSQNLDVNMIYFNNMQNTNAINSVNHFIQNCELQNRIKQNEYSQLSQYNKLYQENQLNIMQYDDKQNNTTQYNNQSNLNILDQQEKINDSYTDDSLTKKVKYNSNEPYRNKNSINRDQNDNPQQDINVYLQNDDKSNLFSHSTLTTHLNKQEQFNNSAILNQTADDIEDETNLRGQTHNEQILNNNCNMFSFETPAPQQNSSKPKKVKQQKQKLFYHSDPSKQRKQTNLNSFATITKKEEYNPYQVNEQPNIQHNFSMKIVNTQSVSNIIDIEIDLDDLNINQENLRTYLMQENSDFEEGKKESIMIIQNNLMYLNSGKNMASTQLGGVGGLIDKQCKLEHYQKMCYCIILDEKTQKEQLVVFSISNQKVYVTSRQVDKRISNFQIKLIEDTKEIDLMCCHYNQKRNQVILTILRKNNFQIFGIQPEKQITEQLERQTIQDLGMNSTQINYKMFSDFIISPNEKDDINRIFLYDFNNLIRLQYKIGSNLFDIKKITFEEGISFVKSEVMEDQRRIIVGLSNKCIKKLKNDTMVKTDVLRFDYDQYDLPIDCQMMNKDIMCIILRNGVIYYNLNQDTTKFQRIENLNSAYVREDKLYVIEKKQDKKYIKVISELSAKKVELSNSHLV